jgi:hypothetical protein
VVGPPDGGRVHLYEHWDPGVRTLFGDQLFSRRIGGAAGDKGCSAARPLRTEVDDPDGLVRLALREDGRLLSLFIDDAARTRLTNLALEKKLNDLLPAANEAMRLSRRQHRLRTLQLRACLRTRR